MTSSRHARSPSRPSPPPSLFLFHSSLCNKPLIYLSIPPSPRIPLQSLLLSFHSHTHTRARETLTGTYPSRSSFDRSLWRAPSFNARWMFLAAVGPLGATAISLIEQCPYCILLPRSSSVPPASRFLTSDERETTALLTTVHRPPSFPPRAELSYPTLGRASFNHRA